MSSNTVAYRAVVSAILTDKGGRVLLQQRDEKPDLLYSGWWTLFGGYVEEGETVEAALRRELREELDLELPLTYWQAYTCPVRTKPGEVVTMNHVYIGQLDQPLESLSLHEGKTMEFFEPKDAAPLNLAFAQHMILRDFLHERHGIDNQLKFLFYSPSERPAKATYPLIIFLHGSGERGDDLALVKKHGITQFLEQGGKLPTYVIAPQCPLDMSWRYAIDRLDVLYERLLRDYPIDADRVYLTGFSLGGFGAWLWANEYPNRFAALMPVAGSGYRAKSGEYKIDLAKLADLPTWMIHSAADEAVLVKGADDFYRDSLAAGGRLGYTRYPDADHIETARRAYFDRSLYEWMLRQKRTLGV